MERYGAVSDRPVDSISRSDCALPCRSRCAVARARCRHRIPIVNLGFHIHPARTNPSGANKIEQQLCRTPAAPPGDNISRFVARVVCEIGRSASHAWGTERGENTYYMGSWDAAQHGKTQWSVQSVRIMINPRRQHLLGDGSHIALAQRIGHTELGALHNATRNCVGVSQHEIKKREEEP